MDAMTKHEGRLFVPAQPTLWPGMLAARRPARAGFIPFSHPRAHWFYFARNGVWLAAKMLGLDQGEVLMPAYHHGVEVEALVDAGATPRFYRVGARWDVDVEDVARRIGPRTRALYLTHYAGFPGPVREMKRLAEQHGLVLIEDCALSLLSGEGSAPLGSTGDVGIFCLYKTLPVPDGGALVINGARSFSLPRLPAPPRTSTVSQLLSSLLENLELRGGRVGRSLRTIARRLGRSVVKGAGLQRVPVGTQHFDRGHVDLGMSALGQRIAAAQDLEAIVERRRRNYFLLLGRLRDVAAPLFNQLPPGVCPLFFPLLVDDKPRVLASLRESGVDAVDFWHRFHPACPASEFPEVADLRQRVVELPCHQDLSPELMQQVAERARVALAKQRTRRAQAVH